MTPDELIELRKQAGMSQEQLAVALGLNRRTIYRYEKGDVGIKHVNELALRQVLAGSISVARSVSRKSKSNK